jgi:hypothetical protein
MRLCLLAGVAGLGLFFAETAGQGPAPAAPRDGPRWLTDFAQAREVARQTGKPIFAVLC